MNWTILNVSIPVYDLQKSKQFYDMLIGYNENQEILYQTLYKNEESIFFGDKGFGLRLFKPIPDLSISNHIQSRRSYITLLVDNLENTKEKLELKDIKFIYNKSDDGLFNNNRGLHVIKPDDGFGYRNNFAHNPSIAGHPAFTIKNLSNLTAKLDEEKILYSDAKVYAMPGFHQIYLYDNNANMLEINEAV